jgi:hypothetical protein
MGASVGLRLGAVIAVDIDVLDPAAAALMRQAAELTLGESPARIGRAPKLAMLFRVQAAMTKRRIAFWLPGDDRDKDKPHAVEVLASGQMIVLDGVHSGTGQAYRWDEGRPALANLPLVDEEAVLAFLRAVEAAIEMVGGKIVQSTVTAPSEDRRDVDQAGLQAPSAAVLAEALQHCPNDGSRDGWIKIGIAVKAASLGLSGMNHDGLPLWEAWSEKCQPEDPDDLQRRWDGFRGPFSVGWPWIERQARAGGWTGGAVLDFAGIDAPVLVPRPAPGVGARRVTVHLRPGEMHRDADLVLSAVLGDPEHGRVFDFGGRLCTIRAGRPKTVREQAGVAARPTPFVFTYCRHSLRRRLMESCAFMSTERGKRKGVAAPPDLVDMILAEGGAGAPRLQGIMTAPVLRPDGTILAAEGYDPGTGLFTDLGGIAFPAIAEAPSQTEAAAALDQLRREAFEGFPFACESDFAVAAAAFLTGLGRRAIGAAPMFIAVAPAQGTGKTALAELIAHLAFGYLPGAQGWPAKEEEREKTILAVLREGAQVVFFDNVKDGGALDSPALARAITGSTYKARVLGVSESAEVPSSALWLATGNNISAAGDLPSRAFICSLDARTERPDMRTHGRDLKDWADLHRPRMVALGLTILRAYQAAGCPDIIRVPSRFRGWDRMVRAPLAFAAGVDCLAEKLQAAGEDDPDQAARRELLDAWAELYGESAVSAGEVAKACDRASADFATVAVGAAPAGRLRTALAALGKWHVGQSPNPERIAAVLGSQDKRVAGDRRLAKEMDSRAKTYRYRLEVVGVQPPQPPQNHRATTADFADLGIGGGR